MLKRINEYSFRADINGNEVLELSEISSRITFKTKEHLALALRENIFIFTAIDQNPRNGKYIHNNTLVLIKNNFNL